MRRTAEMTVLTEPHEFRNYNVGLLLTRLRPMAKSERMLELQALRGGLWGQFISAALRASQQ
jgi:hypothetical protein